MSDNQPQVRTCPNCGGSLVNTSHGPYCPNQHCKWGWEVELDGSPLKPPLPQPTPAEPRIETLTMKQLKKAVEKCRGDGQHNCYLGNRLAVHEIMGTRARQKAGAQPEPEERAELVANISSALTAVSRDHMSVGNALQLIIDEIKTYDAGRARAGSSLSAESDEFLNIPFSASPCGHSSQYAFSENGGKNIICLLCERASPPSSPGAAPERSNEDYAIEHGEYLAKAAEQYLQQRNFYDEKSRKFGCGTADDDTLSDHFSALNDAIYEFRKRAKRCSPGAPQEQK